MDGFCSRLQDWNAPVRCVSISTTAPKRNNQVPCVSAGPRRAKERAAAAAGAKAVTHQPRRRPGELGWRLRSCGTRTAARTPCRSGRPAGASGHARRRTSAASKQVRCGEKNGAMCIIMHAPASKPLKAGIVGGAYHQLAREWGAVVESEGDVRELCVPSLYRSSCSYEWTTSGGCGRNAHRLPRRPRSCPARRRAGWSSGARGRA